MFIKNPTAKKGTFIDSSSLSNNKTKARNPSTYSQLRSRKKKHVESTPLQPELHRKRKTNGNAILREKSTRTRTRSSRWCARKRSVHHQRTKQMSTRKQSKRGRRRQGIKRIYILTLEKGFICQYGRVVKAIDLKSIGVPPRRFEPCC